MPSRREFIKKSGIVAGSAMLAAPLFTKIFAKSSITNFGRSRFAIISDLHLDTRSKNEMKMSEYSTECLSATIADLNQEKDLAFVLVLGDLILDGELENAKIVRDNLARLKVPAYVICGNHDFAPFDKTKWRDGFTYLNINQFVEYFRDYGYGKDLRRYYAREITPGLRIIGLDACLTGVAANWGGILPQEQLKWLDQQLTDNSNALNIIFLHHNLIRWSEDEQTGGSKEKFCIENEKDVKKILTKHAQVAPVVFTGHRHIGLNVKTENDVNYFTVPSINSHPMRYSVFDITPNQISWKTPMVNLLAEQHIEARGNLLSADWWRQSKFREKSPGNDRKVLELYENNAMMLGELGI